MPYVKVETSVPRHRKFVKAGPAPSWLWLCGNCYCQDSLTDGFIPDDALPYLGVRNAKQLVHHLVEAGLWEAVDGGWQVHDYLDHNRSAADIASLKARRASGGKHGGRPRKNLSQNLPDTVKVSAPKPISETFPVAVAVVEAVLKERGPGKTDPPLDVWLRELQAAYPPSAVSSGHLTEQAFVAAVLSQGEPLATFAAMEANLVSQKAGHQWRVKGMIPRLDRWLRDGLWKQVHEREPVAEPMAPWSCPHVDRCGNRSMCEAATVLGRPVRADAVAL